MANGGNGFTKGGNLRRADLNTVCHWVLNAWNDISDDIIVRAFKKCGISNCLSGSEDHLIYDDCEDDKDDESDEDAAGSDEDEEYDEQPDEGEEPDEGEKSDEDENMYEYNKWPECYVVIG